MRQKIFKCVPLLALYFLCTDACTTQLRVEEFTALSADEQHREDEISDPEEDTLAGQMAAMRGGSVKKRKEESDDESSTDDDEAAANDSSSDSD